MKKRMILTFNHKGKLFHGEKGGVTNINKLIRHLEKKLEKPKRALNFR